MSNVFIGLGAAHIALMEDEESFTYATPVDVGELGGIISISLDAQTNSDVLYATDRPWEDAEIDNGLTGNIRIANAWSDPTLRALVQHLLGYKVAADGTELGVSDGVRPHFALLSGRTGTRAGKRICYLYCQLGKPDTDAETKGSSVNWQTDEFPIIIRPVKLPGGWTGNHYAKYPGQEGYEGFFDGVLTDLEASSSALPDATLSALTLGTTALAPAFSADTSSYTAATTASSVNVTAAAADPTATVVIKNGSATVTNGGSASLSSGVNTITVTVTNGTASRVYTVKVTKS